MGVEFNLAGHVDYDQIFVGEGSDGLSKEIEII